MNSAWMNSSTTLLLSSVVVMNDIVSVGPAPRHPNFLGYRAGTDGGHERCLVSTPCAWVGLEPVEHPVIGAGATGRRVSCCVALVTCRTGTPGPGGHPSSNDGRGRSPDEDSHRPSAAGRSSKAVELLAVSVPIGGPSVVVQRFARMVPG